MLVQNNSASFQILNNLIENNNTAIKFLNQIASGTLSSSDNPANIAIASKMLSEMTASTMALNNVDRTISAVQTADSWTSQVSDALSRMKELAIKAGDGTLSATDKANIATEFKALQDEIVQITSYENAEASFNGTPLLQGGEIQTQIGSDSDQTITVDLADLSIENSEVIGEVVTYDSSSNPNITEVKWNEIIDSVNGLEVTDEISIGAIDEAIDYVSTIQTQNATDIKTLENMRGALLDYESNIMDAESKLMDVDIAMAVTNYTQASILSGAGVSVLSLSNQISDSVLQSLL
jgi:flagellin